MPKKLIEVALPLENINREAAHEKMPGIGSHPRGLHLWWARRPFTAARAVIWASLVDDPSEHPELFPTEAAQTQERERLFQILSDLVIWENSNNEDVLSAAKAEIAKYTNGNPPALLDPFAGGGAIPLEAQRLGLEAHGHDLNPVAVMISKAMIEIPPRFSGRSPVNPEARREFGTAGSYAGAAGLAKDVAYYGEWMKDEAFQRIGHLYPKVKVPEKQGGGEATVIAWIWARTVRCPNPACGCEMPLVKSFDLSKKKGNEAHISLEISGTNIQYNVESGESKREGTISREGGVCPCCGTPVGFPYIRSQGQQGKIGSKMVAVVSEGQRKRIYSTPDEEQIQTAVVDIPEDFPSGKLSGKCRVNVSLYGFDETGDLFTPRQLTALTTFSDLVGEAQEKAEADALAAGMADDGVLLSEGGSGARAYGEAVGVYLAFAVDRLADFSTSVSRWSPTNEKPMNCFARQAIPMTWDFPEANPMGNAVGSFSTILKYISDCIFTLPDGAEQGYTSQFDAQSDCGLRNIMISTDPPYYDNIGYADLSDFFYVWMRRSLRKTYPDLFRTMLVPKAEELIATPYRHDGSREKAKAFFEDGMVSACKQINKMACEDVPVTIYYAYKQSDAEESSGTASSGWETMLSALIQAGFTITGTWPMRTEQTYRSVGMGTNALASSIVLVCRKRSETARSCSRRDFVTALRRELQPALQKLQQSNIAPVDLAQSAIGPGIGVFSRYAQVLEADGTPMGVRDALKIINQELDVYFSGQDSGIDSGSRFCVELFTQSAYNTIKYGEADVLARAKGTSIERLKAQKVLFAEHGEVRLFVREELPVNPDDENVYLLMQQMTRAMETGGIRACAEILSQIKNGENAKKLAYRLYSVCERKNWTQEAFAFNSLVAAWPDIETAAAALRSNDLHQTAMF